MRSHLLTGKVRHRRVSPFTYELEHEMHYFALDLDELDAVDDALALVSRNRRNVLSFRDADHWEPPAEDLRATVHAHLRDEGWDPTGWRITLVASLRVLGYVFNPASFYLCRDAEGVLRAVIVEVHNTHLERRLYTLRPEERGNVQVAQMGKDHYVSPFISMDARYTVRVRDRRDRLVVVIDETEAGEPLLQASMNLRRRRLTNRTLLRALLRNPLITHKTIAMIHLHALRLWRRGATFHPHGAGAR